MCCRVLPCAAVCCRVLPYGVLYGVLSYNVLYARLVEVGGLKAVLPIFMGRGAARKLRQKASLLRG